MDFSDRQVLQRCASSMSSLRRGVPRRDTLPIHQLDRLALETADQPLRWDPVRSQIGIVT
jgi:hypothetical protein